jgi:hypothetical protein
MDFVLIQQLLGDKGLSLNPAKTSYEEEPKNIADEVDEMKVSLLKVRRFIIEISGMEVEDEDLEESSLSEEQVEYLLDLLKNPDIEESDAELVLVLLREHGEDVLPQLEGFLRRFPGLSRNVYHFAKHVGDRDKDALAQIVFDFAADGAYATEDQLFWMAKLSEEFLSKTSRYRDILLAIYQHQNATEVSKAKILEIPEQRFGMPELRHEHLRVGKSDWLSWSSAVGSRAATKISRNHALTYFGKASPMNRLIADCVMSI